MSDQSQSLDSKFDKFQCIVTKAKACRSGKIDRFVQRCEVDLHRLMNSFALTLMETCDAEGVILDEKALAQAGQNTLDDQFSTYKMLMQQVQDSDAVHVKSFLARFEATLCQLLTVHFLTCYDLVEMVAKTSDNPVESDPHES